MNRSHVLQSSPSVQQMMAAGNPNWWSINNMSPSSQPTASSFLAPSLPLPPNLLNQFIIQPPLPPPPSSSPSLPLSSSWNYNNQELPGSWNQLLLLGGLVGEEDKSSCLSNMQMDKKIEIWEEDLLQQNQTTVDVKKEKSMNNFGNNNNMYDIHHGNNAELFQTASGKPFWSQIMPVSSPNSCVTTLSGANSNILDFSSKFDARHPPPTHPYECNNTTIGGTLAKKAKVQPSTTQSTFKVRKEKLGDRITALHQIVSPFGKTDTASVLLEAIGYIRFLQNQIEALSLPYLSSGSGNMRQQQHVIKGDRNCLFPEDPGQLLNDGLIKKKGIPDKEKDEEAKKDLKSRGLCLVPIPCTMQVGSDNGADYWAPAAFNGGFR